MAVILGIDPGSRTTGYGVINAVGNKLTYIDSGCIRAEKGELADRLNLIFTGVHQIIQTHIPQEMSIEQVFMAHNADSALKLGQARGVAIVAATTQEVPVFEYSARQVKQAVVGKGAAEKQQVQHMVCRLLGLSKTPQADAADALAIAICHANTKQGLIRISGAKRIRHGRLRR